MIRVSDLAWFTLVSFSVALMWGIHPAHAMDYQNRSWLTPGDYLLGSQEPPRDAIFDNTRAIDLSTTIGIGSDCGRVDFQSTLRSTLSNVLDSKYFGDLGQGIIASSPMLLACYFSPTWCAILKHSQISAHYLSQMRLDQCSLMDKYVDNRVEDFYQERQSCIRKAIDQNGGNLENAMQSCNGNSLYQADLSNWAGSQYGAKVPANRLIGSSAQWAGIDSSPQGKSSVDLLKSFVGDTVVSQGSISVDYGPSQHPVTPRTYLASLEDSTHDTLCLKLLQRAVDRGQDTPPEGLISEADLESLTPDFDHPLVDMQTIRSLSLMPQRERDLACKKLSNAVSLTVFSTETNRAIDVLTTLSQNPNLPDSRRKELIEKRQALKDSVDETLVLQKERNEPINHTLTEINQIGAGLRSESVRNALEQDAEADRSGAIQKALFDCSDGVLCDDAMGR